MKEYAKFLSSKALYDEPTGLPSVVDLNDELFEFQQDIVRWALRRGRAAIFADCGLGKTLMQLEWARHIPGDVLILAPLAVAAQTVREGKKFGIKVNRCQSQADVKPGINIANYERLESFDASKFMGVVLDESSILKSYDGKTRTLIIDAFARTPFRLAATATPSPNDYMELGNHAEFLGVMTREEMLAMFFVHDGGETQKWRIKGHAEGTFWKWVCDWAVMIRKPSDLGYSDGKFKLPELHMHEHIVRATNAADGELFAMPAATLQERIGARRATVVDRVKNTAERVNKSKEPWIVWCNLNSESELLSKMIPDAVEVKGSDSPEHKEKSMMDFADGKIRVLVTKSSICGFGMNFQVCPNMDFVGLTDSYEEFYQAVRRCWRFGQKKDVHAHMVCADTEGAVLQNIKRKEKDMAAMAAGMVKNMKDLNAAALHDGGTKRQKADYNTAEAKGDKWTMRLGDCVEEIQKVKTASVHYSIYSPPFASLYTYSNSDRDMGNCADTEQFLEHYRFLVKELFRTTMPGRLTSFHCMDLPTSKVRDGIIGLRDFRGELLRIHQEAGWVYHSGVTIWKDPVTAMQRTKAIGLLYKQLKKDSHLSRQGIPDYLVTMRKPGENPEPITHTPEDFPVDLWQKYASPVWMDINQNETLQYRSARENNDERHVCPLQLEVIRRGVKLWSNPGDLVLSPFAGIGSEGHESVKGSRRFLGFELKESYFKCAVNNMKAAESALTDGMLL